MRIYTLDQLRVAATPAIPAILGPMTPARYLRLCRGAAGLTVDVVARRLAPREVDRAEAADLLRVLEVDGNRARQRETIERLSNVMPIDADVYFQLADEPADRHPLVCVGCGWTTHQHVAGETPRSWALPCLCSACAERGDLFAGYDADTAA